MSSDHIRSWIFISDVVYFTERTRFERGKFSTYVSASQSRRTWSSFI